MAASLAVRGYQRSLTHVEAASLKPYCDAPVALSRCTDPRAEDRTMLVEAYVPCRRCARCLHFRSMQWRDRIVRETVWAHARECRTWFGTLTLSDVHAAGVYAEAARLKKPQDRDRRIDVALHVHVQRYFKRLRKQGHRFRYFAMVELGSKTGRLHCHLMVHELAASIGRRDLDGQWRSFTKFKLVDPDSVRTARYVAKYVAKSHLFRPRASLSYGKVWRCATADAQTNNY